MNMYRRTIGIDPIESFKLIIQKFLPIYKYYVHGNEKDETRHVLISFLNAE